MSTLLFTVCDADLRDVARVILVLAAVCVHVWVGRRTVGIRAEWSRRLGVPGLILSIAMFFAATLLIWGSVIRVLDP